MKTAEIHGLPRNTCVYTDMRTRALGDCDGVPIRVHPLFDSPPGMCADTIQEVTHGWLAHGSAHGIGARLPKGLVKAPLTTWVAHA
jgi:hypothetical protein